LDRSDQMVHLTPACVENRRFFRNSFVTMAIVLAFLIAPTISFGGTPKAGSWFIDNVKFHVSAHGQISCQDCHADIKQLTHPNPADVTRSRADFFNSAMCFNCHDADSMKTNLAKGLHGGKPVEKVRDYSDCITCHDPHYQPHLSKKSVSTLEVSAQGPELCGKCHEKKEALPPPVAEDAKCFECHNAASPRDSDRANKLATFCLGCHKAKAMLAGTAEAVPVIDPGKHISGGHGRLDCMRCHLEAARFEHHRQGSVTCRSCHPPHHEATIHDAHAMVACQACHLSEIKPIRDIDTGKVVWAKSSRTKRSAQLNIVRPDPSKDFCRRCHYAGNTVAAAAMILPAKSIICMPCHASTFSVKDTGSVLAILGFGLGMCVVASVWLSAASSQRTGEDIGRIQRFKSAPFTRLAAILKSLFLDILLQRRLYLRSRSRWLIHGLIFWPFLVRFGWGLIALAGSLALPNHDWVWDMLDKNDPLTAFVFDFTGVMIIAGIVLAVFRKRITGEAAMNDLPDHDWWAVGLLGAIVIVGFILEGARIAMTGAAGDARLAFVGWALSFLWRGTRGLSEIYGYIWYLHAFLTGAFWVYLPFSRLFHIIIAPLVAVLSALNSSHHRQDEPPHRVH
jgi:predicted CXXCH cytochrome family protein